MINLTINVMAFMKMQALVAYYTSEVGWYGTARKLDEENYIIDDILVYPQYVEAAYIDDDIIEMQEWLNTLDTYTYNHKRFHAHSHVNMGVTPSSTDNNTYEKFKKQNSMAEQNRFTISMIVNKYGECSCRIYDADIDEEYINENINIEIAFTDNYLIGDFLNDIDSLVKTKNNNTIEL